MQRDGRKPVDPPIPADEVMEDGYGWVNPESRYHAGKNPKLGRPVTQPGPPQ